MVHLCAGGAARGEAARGGSTLARATDRTRRSRLPATDRDPTRTAPAARPATRAATTTATKEKVTAQT